MDYEFEAFKKGFNEGMLTTVAIFDITFENIRKNIEIDTINSRIYQLYLIWQNTIKDKKIEREDDILAKKVKIKNEDFKTSIINYINKKL